MEKLITSIANGSVTYLDRDDATSDVPWSPHAKFPGVALKHIIKGKDTDGMLSCHMVRIDPNCLLEDHIHESQWELHEVIQGDGTLIFESKESKYKPGRMAIIPKGKKHKVIAGENGMYMLVKFFPALL
jgi:quercetin dioxygenase-like cupin family protein